MKEKNKIRVAKSGLQIIIVLILNTITYDAISIDTLRSVNDMKIVRSRMLVPYLDSPDPLRVHQMRSGLGTDGSWLDINYADTSTTSWLPAGHLRRLVTLTQAWYSPSSPLYHDKELYEQINSALDYWFHLDPRRPWWWDSIGAPRMIGWILLMLDENLTDYQRKQGIKVLERAILGTTGQNLVWQAEITARRAILQKDEKLLMKAFDLIASEIKLSEGEGIQADFSFHQHGPCLYNHGYGVGFAEENAQLASLTAGTVFEYKPEKITLLSNLILDGSQWFALGPVSDFAAEGRELTRPGENARYLSEAAKYMLTLPTGRENEFKALYTRTLGKPADPLTGNKHFFRSDIMVHHRPGWYMSAKMYSKRTVNTDGLSGCDEGLLSHYLAEGATTIMRHGNEYKNIFPVWDWQHIPGTTVEMKTHIPGEPKRRGTSAFAGGASDGTIGVAGFQLKRDSLSAKKAWFFFSDIAVCLGTSIHCMTDNQVITTLNQCLLSDPVSIGYDKGREILSEGERKIIARWIIHDGIAYVPSKSTELEIA
ncbi:polysaccharide lyase family 8 super-sandwich domain-containing protein, partial [Bacteroidota bacterium]